MELMAYIQKKFLTNLRHGQKSSSHIITLTTFNNVYTHNIYTFFWFSNFLFSIQNCPVLTHPQQIFLDVPLKTGRKKNRKGVFELRGPALVCLSAIDK